MSDRPGTRLVLLVRVVRAIDRLNAWLGRQMLWCVLVAVLVAAACAVLRKAFALYSNAWSELQWQLFGAACLFSAAWVLQLDEHVRVDVLAQRWSARTRAWLDLVVLVGVAMPLCATMVVLGTEHAWSAFRHGEGSYMPDGLVIWPSRALVPIGFALLGLQSLAQTLRCAVMLRLGHWPSDAERGG